MTVAQVARVLHALGKLWQDGEGDHFQDIQVLAMRFGLLGGRPHTYEEIGGIMALSREEVRQRETRLLDRLAQATAEP